MAVTWAITSVLFQPLSLAAGVRVPVTIGAVLSMLTVWLKLALLPAASVQMLLTTCPAPSAGQARHG